MPTDEHDDRPVSIRDHFHRLSYDAAYHALLSGRYTGNVADMALDVTVAVSQLWDLYNPTDMPGQFRRFFEDEAVRRPLVIGLLVRVDPALWEHARPLVDAAVEAAARAAWEGPNAVRYDYPLPGRPERW